MPQTLAQALPVAVAQPLAALALAVAQTLAAIAVSAHSSAALTAVASAVPAQAASVASAASSTELYSSVCPSLNVALQDVFNSTYFLAITIVLLNTK